MRDTMRARRVRRSVVVLASCVVGWNIGCVGAFEKPAAGSVDPAPHPGPGHGRPATPEAIARVDIGVLADGSDLPPGRGTASEGEALYIANCLRCHGLEGAGKPADRLVGGVGSLAGPKPIKTVGSYWPLATTLFDYLRRAMPYDRPGSLSDDEIYGLAAYLLALNGIIDREEEMNADTLPRVAMPNRDGFVRDDGSDLPR